jgi:hypothetical protein
VLSSHESRSASCESAKKGGGVAEKYDGSGAERGVRVFSTVQNGWSASRAERAVAVVFGSAPPESRRAEAAKLALRCAFFLSCHLLAVI